MVRRIICLSVVALLGTIGLSVKAHGILNPSIKDVSVKIKELEETKKDNLQYVLKLHEFAFYCTELGLHDYAFATLGEAFVRFADIWDMVAMEDPNNSLIRKLDDRAYKLISKNAKLKSLAESRGDMYLTHFYYYNKIRVEYFPQYDLSSFYIHAINLYDCAGGKSAFRKKIDTYIKLGEYCKETNRLEDALSYISDAILLIQEDNSASELQQIELFLECTDICLKLGSTKEAYKAIKMLENYELPLLMKAKWYNNYANYCLLTNDAGRAATMLKTAIDLYKQTLPTLSEQIVALDPPAFVPGLIRTAALYNEKKKYEEVLGIYRQIEDMLVQIVNPDLPYIIYSDRVHLWRMLRPYFNEMQRFAFLHSNVGGAKEFLYENNLLRKKLSLTLSPHIPSDRPIAYDKQAMELIREIERLLNNDATTNIKLGTDLVAKIKNDVQAACFMRNLQSHLQTVNEEKLMSKEPWSTIASNLSDNEAIIDFLEIDLPDSEQKKYVAICLAKSFDKPLLVPLCWEGELRKTINQESQAGKALYSLIWKPLEQLLNNVNNIHISPAGLLSTVSFAGMHDGKNYLCDKYRISYLLTSESLSESKKKTSETSPLGKKNIYLFGGADFGLPATKKQTTRGQGFAYLAESKREIEQIAQTLSEKNNWNVYKYIGKEATEEELRSLSWKPDVSVIHISTHGFYLPYNTDIDSRAINVNGESGLYDPLLRTGLAFTGASYAWKDSTPINMKEDGLLTALEIASMGLNDTELVVLSACNTGLGEIRDGEGVYGLQLALRAAGVKSMIVSLKDVPDKETSELMCRFYTLWQSGLNKRDAFVQAQQTLKNKYPDDPDKWAWFVLIE